jgi:hypothetical protein
VLLGIDMSINDAVRHTVEVMAGQVYNSRYQYQHHNLAELETKSITWLNTIVKLHVTFRMLLSRQTGS